MHGRHTVKVVLIGFLVVLLSASTLSAQDTDLETADLEADSLRARLQCPSMWSGPHYRPKVAKCSDQG